MQFTQAEITAANEFSQALLRLLTALEAGMKARQTPQPERPKVQTIQVTSNGPLLVSAREATKLLSLSARTLWGLTAPRGPIPSVKLGRLVRYSMDDLKKALETMKSNSSRGSKHED